MKDNEYINTINTIIQSYIDCKKNLIDKGIKNSFSNMQVINQDWQNTQDFITSIINTYKNYID